MSAWKTRTTLNIAETDDDFGQAVEYVTLAEAEAALLSMRERAAKVAIDAREDEEYGHAAFRCVQICQCIEALPLVAPDEEKK